MPRFLSPLMRSHPPRARTIVEKQAANQHNWVFLHFLIDI